MRGDSTILGRGMLRKQAAASCEVAATAAASEADAALILGKEEKNSRVK